MTGKGRSFSRNSAFVFGANLTTAALAVVTTVATARLLGPEGRGLYSVGVLLPWLLFTLASLGLPTATTYLTARGRFADDIVLRASIVETALVGLLAAVLGGLIFLTIARSLLGDLPTEDVLITLASLPFLFVFTTLQAYLLGRQRYDEYNASSVIQATIVLILVVGGLLVVSRSFDVAIAATTIGTAVGAVGLVAWCTKMTRPARTVPGGFLREAGRFGIQSHLSNVLTFLGYRLDVFLLVAYTSAGTVGIYSAAVAIGERPWIFSFAVSTVLFSRLSGEQDEQRRRDLTPAVARNVFWLTAFAAAALALLSGPLVLLFYSSSFAAAVNPLRAILAGIVFFSIGRVLGNDIAARGRPIVNSFVAGAAVVVNVVLNVVLIPRYGATGAALASTFSYLLLFLLTAGYYCRLSGNSPASIIVPTSGDMVIWREWLTAALRRVTGSAPAGRGGRVHG